MVRVALLMTLAVGCGFEAPLGGTAPDATPPGDASPTDADIEIDAPPPSACPGTYTLVHGTSRYRKGPAATWYDAQRGCEDEGTHLIVIGDGSENTFLTTMQPTGGLWLGLSDHLDEGTFRWVIGAALTYDNWQGAPPEPDDDGGREDCAALGVAGVWHDTDCAMTLAYVCECDGAPQPPPTWCETGTDRSCDSCEDRCDQQFDGDGQCNGSQVCVDGD